MIADIESKISSKMDKVFSKIISGGQTGVDRAALDVALELGIPCGGLVSQR
jgi:predicted Rossmann fold nucleotide-binding protein DprA/Smf involved in DNA uptake